MITKNDWDAALDAWVTEERERLGGPPTPEEVVAYTRGELADAEAARVRALLVYYPELTSLLLDDADAPALPKRWTPHSLLRFMPLAAGLLIALLTVLLIQSRGELARSAQENRTPYVHQTRYELQALQSRGVGELPVYELPPGEERYLLALTLLSETAYERYRIDIVAISGGRSNVVSTMKTVRPAEGTLELSVPRPLIQSGTFRIDVYGIEGDRTERVESFRIRIGDA
jgi:hypothetical protein